MLNFGSFLINCILRLIRLPGFDLVVGMTSPPLISWLGALYVQLKGGRFLFWVMDLNPDEAIAAGWLHDQSRIAKVLNITLQYSLHHAAKILVLDRFMKVRISRKGIPEYKITVIPPWSHDDVVRYDGEGRAAFRLKHGLSEKFVVMYSGNHSPCHPLDTLLQAARRLADQKNIAFFFVGGGSEFGKVKAFADGHGLTNILCLPYQPLDALSASLSSADLHVVVMGERLTGMVHPCKIYNILTIGAPFLYIGPAESHITDILSQLTDRGIARVARHGDVDAVVRHVVAAARVAFTARPAVPLALAARFSKKVLLPQMIHALASACGEIAARHAGALRSRKCGKAL